MPTVSSHEKVLRRMPCAVSRRTPVTLHHCHGGSIKDLGWMVGTGQRQNPFLQIPLHEAYHTGNFGIDTGMGIHGVKEWEHLFGTQVSMLKWVEEQLGYEISEFAANWEKVHRGKALNGGRRL